MKEVSADKINNKGDSSGVFLLASKSNNSYTFISVTADIMMYGKGYYLLAFNELDLAKEYFFKLKNGFENNTQKKDFETDELIIKKINDQYRWDIILEILTNGDIHMGIVNPCMRDDHKCVTYPFILKDYKDLSKLKDLFNTVPRTHTSFNKGDTLVVMN